jgi:hypothetical protein
MKPSRAITLISVAVLVCASVAIPAEAKKKQNGGSGNRTALQNCMLASDSDMDRWRISDAVSCCSKSLGICLICPNDVSKRCERYSYFRGGVRIQPNTSVAVPGVVAPVETRPEPARPRLSPGSVMD